MPSATQTINGYTIASKASQQDGTQAQATPGYNGDVSSTPRRSSDLPRAASYTYVGSLTEREYIRPSLATVRTKSSGIKATDSVENVVEPTSPESSGWTTPDEYIQLPKRRTDAEHARDLTARLSKNYGEPKANGNGELEDGDSSVASSIRNYRTSVESSNTVSTAATTPSGHTPRPSIASNFSRKLNRRSWIGSAPSTPSRSPSPDKTETPVRVNGHDANNLARPETKRMRSFMRRKDSYKASKEKDSQDTPQTSDAPPERPVSRRSTLLRKKKTRPTSEFFKNTPSNENAQPAGSRNTTPAVPPLPKSFSTDRLPSYRSPPLSPGLAVPTPRLLSTERKTSGIRVVPKRKDELWNVFRTLDADFAKFASKSLALKANVIRSSLLPFLRGYSTHISTRTLRVEDLDRRANILNKWWTGLIELLHGRNNQSISGTDRPVILDGISGIMDRPEWRLAPSPFSPLNQRSKGTATPASRSTTSLTSDTSDFLIESVHHNVRNIFVHNLSAQMAFVVEKMSLRNASASLVTFCGKACAYAFTFVPGMADILARLWELPMDTMRRVLDGNGVRKFDDLSDLAKTIVPVFPPALHQLGFSSLGKYMRTLRSPPPLPIGTGDIQWWGHWLERWKGRESDLFYVFVKHFHILVTDFLPTDATKSERMCTPGLLLVHAQILTNLDATVHRDSSQTPQDPTMAGSTPTFDDVLADPDAVASALPIPPINATRLMAENRLIMLIREFLSDRAGDHPVARRLFAESFNSLLEAVTRGTSMFDHAACYTLLDFLEEALPLMARFERIEDDNGPLLDPSFWNMVWRKMISSHNTMTGVRLYAFLYTIWKPVICDLGWRTGFCFGVLLDPAVFDDQFNHWCPMVRAYFMRLLCWRVGRYDGDSFQGESDILEAVFERLRKQWSYYLFLRDRAEQQNTLPPATVPNNPAPSRRLLIVRTDALANAGGAFLTFDGVTPVRPSATTTSLAAKRASTFSQVEIDIRPNSSRSNSDSEPESRGRGLGGFIRNLMGTKSRSKSHGRARSTPPKNQSPAPSPPNGIVRAATYDLQTSRQTPAETDLSTRPSQSTQVKNFSFKFSLEYYPNLKPLPPMRLQPPRLPMPAQQYLQDGSQKFSVSNAAEPIEPIGEGKAHARYSGRALAEWQVVLMECQSFFERRKKEGVPSDKFVETPSLGVEVFKRPG